MLFQDTEPIGGGLDPLAAALIYQSKGLLTGKTRRHKLRPQFN
jgi:hypothetical protein